LRQFALLDYNQWQYSRTLAPVVYCAQDMRVAVQPTLHDPKAERCPRCLQPVPPRASRCPGCRQPVHSLRSLTLVIGAVGLMALLFVVLLMYRMMSNEDAAHAPAPVDEAAAEQQKLFPDPPPPNGKPAESSKPENPPPLNEH
jgi:hypothetical protein